MGLKEEFNAYRALVGVEYKGWPRAFPTVLPPYLGFLERLIVSTVALPRVMAELIGLMGYLDARGRGENPEEIVRECEKEIKEI